MTRILSADLLIADILIPLAEHKALAALVQKLALKPGGKATIDDEQLKALLAATDGLKLAVTPGGSSANMLTSLTRLLGDAVDVRFFGVVGEGAYGSLIRSAMADAKIALLPERLPASLKPQAATSFVFVSEDGQCTIATHPGNARSIFKPAMIAEHIVEYCDILLAQGSLWHKLSPDVADRLYLLCKKYRRQLWLTLPTQAHLTDEEAQRIRRMIPDASLILGNEAELTRLYAMKLAGALDALRHALREAAEQGKGVAHATGFITCGKEGAAVVSADAVEHIDPAEIPSDDIVNTLGAGDTAYAGFAAGYLRDLADVDSARIAMTLAGEKLRINGPRLADPALALKTQAPELARMLRIG